MAITARMYERLFEEYTDTKTFFANTKDDQAQRLANAILAYCKNIDNFDELQASVKAIAKKHVAVKVMPEHYPIVGNVLLSAMQDVLGDAANEQVLEAWGEAYIFLAEIFIKQEQELYSHVDSFTNNSQW